MERKGKGKREKGKWKTRFGGANFQFPFSILRRIGWWLRQVSGDAAYENYLRSARRARDCAHHQGLMTREEFYLDHLRRRYTGVSRCCLG